MYVTEKGLVSNVQRTAKLITRQRNQWKKGPQS